MKPAKLVFLTGILCSCGCATSLFNQTAMETRVIEQFAEALSEENEPALRRITSTHFEDKALRSEDVLRDLRVLHLPTGKLSVVEVKDVDKGRKEVIVKEESGGKYQFHLINDPKKQYWAVDDVVVRQRSKGTQVTKSTAEVMDLLVTLRHFLDVWESGTREEVLAMTSPDLSAALSPLPEAWLKSLTSRVAATYEEGMARKPEANLTQDEAVVKLPSKNGHLLMKIVKDTDGWFIDDVESHNHRDDNHPGSIRRQADAINAVNGFLTAYGATDHDGLQAVTTEKLYDESLKLANLSLIGLPTPSEVPAEFDIRAYEDQLTFMIPAGSEIVRLDLLEQEEDLTIASEELGSRFLVKNVTLYDKATRKQRSLAAVFTAPTRASIFLKALAERDHRMLSQLSSTDFSRATWKRLNPEILTALPIPDFGRGDMELTGSHSLSDTTELEFKTSDGMVLLCRMIGQNGALKIDDVQYPNDEGQVTSLRTRLELSVPVLEFASAWKMNDLELLQKSCSSDFNRLVWSHMDGVPQQFAGIAEHLSAPVVDTRVTQERATLRLGDSDARVSATLVMEHDYWVVDEVRMESMPGQFVEVRHQLRSQIASKLLSGSYSTVRSDAGDDVIVPVEQSPFSEAPMSDPIAVNSVASRSERGGADSAIMQVSGEQPAQAGHREVNQAVYERYVDEDGNPEDSLRITPAVRTRTLSTDTANTNPVTGVQTLGFQSEQPLKTEAGVQIFPGETRIRGRRREVTGQSTLESMGAIDMTPDSDAPTISPALKSSDAGMMYFGPDQSRLGKDKAKRSIVDDTSLDTVTSQRIKEPADAPISIH